MICEEEIDCWQEKKRFVAQPTTVWIPVNIHWKWVVCVQNTSHCDSSLLMQTPWNQRNRKILEFQVKREWLQKFSHHDCSMCCTRLEPHTGKKIRQFLSNDVGEKGKACLSPAWPTLGGCSPRFECAITTTASCVQKCSAKTQWNELCTSPKLEHLCNSLFKKQRQPGTEPPGVEKQQQRWESNRKSFDAGKH